MKKVYKPWGHEIIWAHTSKYVGKVLFIKDGHKLSRQYHEVKDETIYVTNGNLKLEIGFPVESTTILTTGCSYRIETEVIHRFIADNGDVQLMEVSTPELDDVVRLEDDYDRGDKNFEEFRSDLKKDIREVLKPLGNTLTDFGEGLKNLEIDFNKKKKEE